MKAYSLDLRQKIIETYETENISQRQLAKRFRVALSFTLILAVALLTGDEGLNCSIFVKESRNLSFRSYVNAITRSPVKV